MRLTVQSKDFKIHGKSLDINTAEHVSLRSEPDTIQQRKPKGCYLDRKDRDTFIHYCEFMLFVPTEAETT